MNLFEKQQKTFAIKLSERVKEEIKKEFGNNFYDVCHIDWYFHYPNYYDYKGFDKKNHLHFNIQENYTLITEAEFFGDESNKLMEKILKEVGYFGMFDVYFAQEKEATALEQITDDFAVKFAEFIIEPKDKPKGEFTITELLQIFKTQYYE